MPLLPALILTAAFLALPALFVWLPKLAQQRADERWRALSRGRFRPFPGFEPYDGHDERVTLSRDNPVAIHEGGAGRTHGGGDSRG